MTNNQKKPFYKKWWVIALAVVMVAGAFNDDEEVTEEMQAQEVVEAEVIEVIEEPEEIEEEPEPEEEVIEEPEEPTEQIMDVLLADMQESFEDVGTVHFDDDLNGFVVTPTSSEFEAELTLIVNGLAPKDDWISLTETFKTLSVTLSEASGDAALTLWLANPANPGHTLLTAMNGHILYDALADE
ncbi:MAG: hypothetical protein JJU16_05280 [Alkalibacterium sp.]|nr:hypothetical protein [Alkalibacterium sp.]